MMVQLQNVPTSEFHKAFQVFYCFLFVKDGLWLLMIDGQRHKVVSLQNEERNNRKEMAGSKMYHLLKIYLSI